MTSFRAAMRSIAAATIAMMAWPIGGNAVAAPQNGTDGTVGTIVVYFIDHQLLPESEVETLRDEVSGIFAVAGLAVEWPRTESPRRRLEHNELRLIILPSDGTRWFHGPSNVIGIAPHDDTGTGRNCFIFYRQAIWFRQQAVFRCREAIQARAAADLRGVEVDPFIDSLAPEDCGERLASLTAMIVARAAAHEMVHILLNKLDHTPDGLMRSSFDLADWFDADPERFRLGDDEIQQLVELLGGYSPEPAR
jgi:hypothetical protein